MVDDSNKAWHACDANPWSIGLELAGYSAKGFGAPEWQAAANVCAYLMRKHSIPLVHSTKGNGYCSHSDLGKDGGGHHDPMDPTSGNKAWENFEDLLAISYSDPSLPNKWLLDGYGPSPDAPSSYQPSGTQRHDFNEGSIEWVQMRLNSIGHVNPPILVDGIKGPFTTTLIQTFQKVHGLTVDGIVGPLTIAALKAA
jgi:peptidoglycan hydrolase-like protein with peptidoglycan-binding domain